MRYTGSANFQAKAAKSVVNGYGEEPRIELKEDPTFWMDHNVQVRVEFLGTVDLILFYFKFGLQLFSREQDGPPELVVLCIVGFDSGTSAKRRRGSAAWGWAMRAARERTHRVVAWTAGDEIHLRPCGG